MPAQSTLKPASLDVLIEAAQFVLETMFFAESEPVSETMGAPLLADRCIRAEVSFRGDRTGRLLIGLPESCARALAAGFEGIPDEAAVPQASLEQVVKESANMICGATLTRLFPDGLFQLGSPEINLAEGALMASTSEAWLRISYMEDAILHLALTVEEHA